MSFSVKVSNPCGAVSWIVSDNRYAFTKSKAKFILESALKRGLFAGSVLEVIENA